LALFTNPPKTLLPEIKKEFYENCHAPLFLPSELDEWENTFNTLSTTTHPTCDATIFDGLSAHS
jgi:hypothetical protein